MKKQRSVYVQIAFTLLAVYTVYSFFFWIFQIDQVYKYLTVESHRWAASYLTIGRILLREGEVTELAPILDEAIEAREIDYYLIRKGKEDIAFSSSAGADDPIVFPETLEDTTWETPEYKHFVIHQSGYYYAIGYKRGIWNYISNFYEAEKFSLWGNILVISLFGIGLTLYSFRDMREVLNRLRKRSVDRGDLSIAKSAETLTLIQGLRGYQANVDTLTKENLLLKGQVLPALRKEIASGKAPPYEFGCTLVRTDINNFTTIFSNQDRAQFMQTINEFFVGVTHIVSRYKGYVYEFIGDEVIFYFKDEDHLNSPAIALSALRDINRLADEMTESTQDLGYAFKVKSALSWGTLRFGPLVNGFSLAGKPLIETVRILTHVHEKSENTILYEESLSEQVSFLTTSRELGVVMLKGLSQSRRLRVHQAYVPLSTHLRQGNVASFLNASYYRSDRDICETLDFICSQIGVIEAKSLLKLLGHFKSFPVTEFSNDIRKSYLECLEKLAQHCEQGQWKNEDDVFMLSALISAAAELFPSGHLVGRLRQTFIKSLNAPDRRVVANALDVFAALDPDAGEKVFSTLAAHNDNRIVANALIKEAKREWKKSTAKRLGVLMRMQSPYYKASALYALGEIAAHLKSSDEVSFQADSILQLLIDDAAVMIPHANKMVRRQALRTFMKAGREVQLQQMSSDVGLEQELRAEIRLLLGEPEAAAAPAKLRAVS